MANQYFRSAIQTKIPELKALLGQVAVGAAGAVSSFSGSGIKAVTKLAVGIYQVVLTDNYVALMGVSARVVSPNTGAPVASGALVAGTLYTITTVGSTNWYTAGVPANEVPAVGVPFVAAGVAAGTGTATAVGLSGIVVVEVSPGANLTALQVNKIGNGVGCSSVILQCADKTDALASPASGSVLTFQLLLRNSSVSV